MTNKEAWGKVFQLYAEFVPKIRNAPKAERAPVCTELIDRTHELLQQAGNGTDEEILVQEVYYAILKTTHA